MASGDFSEALRAAKKAVKEVSDDVLLEAGHFATALIASRTKRGVDADGQPFRPYSESYAAYREGRGLSSKPDLTVEGHMLGAMFPTVGDDMITVEFNGPIEIAKAMGNVRTRDFFDVRLPSELDALAEVVAESIEEAATK